MLMYNAAVSCTCSDLVLSDAQFRLILVQPIYYMNPGIFLV